MGCCLAATRENEMTSGFSCSPEHLGRCKGAPMHRHESAVSFGQMVPRCRLRSYEVPLPR